MDAKDEKYIRTIGEFFGYPECCTSHFIARLDAARKNPFDRSKMKDVHAEHSNLHGTGFVTCNKHSLEVLEGKIKVEGLIINRKADLPFPQENSKRIRDFIESKKI